MKIRVAAASAAVVVAPFAVAFAIEVSEKPIKTFEREKQDGETACVAWSAKGDQLASSGDRAVYTWDAQTGEQLNRATHGPPGRRAVWVSCVAAYPKAPFMVHCSEFGIKFHLIGGHGKLPSFDAKHKQTPTCLDFSADGDHMASGDKGGELIVWNLWTGEPERRFEAGKELVGWLRYHPDGNRVATVSKDGKCRIFDVKADKMLLEIAAHEGNSGAVSFSADGKWLATGGKDKKIKIWNADDGKAGPVLEGHEDEVESLAFHPKAGSTILASGADDKTVRLWDVEAKKELKKIAHEGKVNCVAWRPDGGALATGAAGLVQVFEVKGEK